MLNSQGVGGYSASSPASDAWVDNKVRELEAKRGPKIHLSLSREEALRLAYLLNEFQIDPVMNRILDGLADSGIAV